MRLRRRDWRDEHLEALARAREDPDEGAKTEREELDVDWPLERDDPPLERSHPGASKGDGS